MKRKEIPHSIEVGSNLSHGLWDALPLPHANQFQLSSCGRFCAISLANSFIELWDIKSIPTPMTCVRIAASESACSCLSWSNSSSHIASTFVHIESKLSTVFLMDVFSGVLKTISSSMIFCRSSSVFLAGSESEMLAVAEDDDADKVIFLDFRMATVMEICLDFATKQLQVNYRNRHSFYLLSCRVLVEIASPIVGSQEQRVTKRTATKPQNAHCHVRTNGWPPLIPQ